MINTLLDVILINRIPKIFLENNLLNLDEFENLINKAYKIAKYSVPFDITKGMIKNRYNKITNYKKQLKYLLTLPVLEQKSLEWYKKRHNLISASDFGSALGEGKFVSQKDFIIKKCEDYKIHSMSGKEPQFKHGIMFEPVGCDIYSKRMSVKIYEFGLLDHKKYDFIAASPDGISELGIMLEIKCPYKRKIDGKIIDQYYLQIQGQLEVCELEECDFVEIDFKHYHSKYEFMEDYNIDNIYTKNNLEKGIIFEYTENDCAGNGTTEKYIYSPLYVEKDKLIEWSNETENKLKIDGFAYKIMYWYVNQYNCQRVYRNEVLFNTILEKMEKVWKKILDWRTNKELYKKEVISSRKTKSNIVDFDEMKLKKYNWESDIVVLNKFAFR
jgi:putative phage-type endonuclease